MTVLRRPLGQGATDHELIWTSVAAVSLGLAWLVLRSPVPLPVCAFKAMTGWPCPTCGATRAAIALLALDPVAALRLNPLVTAVSAAWALYAAYGLGAIAGLWSRLEVRASRRERAMVRAAAWTAIACTWVFLVVDGR